MIYTIIDVPIEASAGRDLGRRTRAHHPCRGRPVARAFSEAMAVLDKAFARVSDGLRTQIICLPIIPTIRSREEPFTACRLSIPEAAPGGLQPSLPHCYYADAARQKTADLPEFLD